MVVADERRFIRPRPDVDMVADDERWSSLGGSPLPVPVPVVVVEDMERVAPLPIKEVDLDLDDDDPVDVRLVRATRQVLVSSWRWFMAMQMCICLTCMYTSSVGTLRG